MLLCYNSQSIFSSCVLNLVMFMKSDGLVLSLLRIETGLRIEFLIKKCCVQGTQYLLVLCLRELMLRLFTAMPAWLVSCLKNVFSCCCSNWLTAQSMGAQAVSPMLVRHMTIQRHRRYFELEDYGTMLPDPATPAGQRVFQGKVV